MDIDSSQDSLGLTMAPCQVARSKDLQFASGGEDGINL